MTLAPYAVDTPWRVLSKSYIEHCHAAGIQVFSDVPSFVDVAGYRQAIEWDIDLIQTDHPCACGVPWNWWLLSRRRVEGRGALHVDH